MLALSPTHPAVIRARDMMRAGRPAGLSAFLAANEYGKTAGDVARGLSACRRQSRPDVARVVAAKSESYWYDQI